MIEFNWRTITASRDPAHEKAGTELECALVARSRFAVISVRVTRWVKQPYYINGGYVQLDCRYEVRDADKISDAQVKAGERPPVVFRADDLDAVVAFLKDNGA